MLVIPTALAPPPCDFGFNLTSPRPPLRERSLEGISFGLEVVPPRTQLCEDAHAPREARRVRHRQRERVDIQICVGPLGWGWGGGRQAVDKMSEAQVYDWDAHSG